jgi:hypothetical protein
MMYLGFSGFLACLIIMLGVLNLFLYSRLKRRLNNLNEKSALLFDLFCENNAKGSPESIIVTANRKSVLDHPKI